MLFDPTLLAYKKLYHIGGEEEKSEFAEIAGKLMFRCEWLIASPHRICAKRKKP